MPALSIHEIPKPSLNRVISEQVAILVSNEMPSNHDIESDLRIMEGLSTFVVEDEGMILATAALRHMHYLNAGMIRNVVTIPAARGSGFGRAVVERVVQKAKDEDMREVKLFSSPVAKGFYKNLGFKLGHAGNEFIMNLI